MKGLLLLPLFVLISCGHVRTDGGQAPYDPELYSKLTPEEHLTYAQTVVKREERDPDGITLAELKKTRPLKKLAVILFETQFQPSLNGLADTGSSVYLSAKGRQILTEFAYKFWEKNLKQGVSVEWVPRKTLEQSKAFRGYGSVVQDLILARKYKLTDEEIFWKSGGQAIPTGVSTLPRNQQDVSVLYIPATEMMIMPKMVAHQNHWVNDICKELGLDAVVIVSSKASWKAGGKDKRTQEVIPEEMKVSVEASLLYPFSVYHTALKGKNSDPAKKSVTAAVYSVETKLPVKITVPENEQNFETSMSNIVLPLRTTYNALSKMVIERMISDIQQTHQN